MVSLRSWLKQAPQPASLRIRDDQDDTRAIELHPNQRNRWRFAEDAILAARARVVEALNEKGAILRTYELEHEDGDDTSETKDTAAKLSSKVRGETYREIAGVIDRYGERMVQSFREGAGSQRELVEQMLTLVETLSANLSAALVNFHNVTVALGEQIKENAQANGEEGSGGGNRELLAKVLGSALANGMSGGGGGASPNGSNGKPKGGKS
jgi:hypothetical protein